VKRIARFLPLAVLAPVAMLAALRSLPACATVQVTGPVPEDGGLTGPCASQPQVYCDAATPPGGPTCSPDPDAGYYQGLVPAQTYAQGCIVNFPDPRPLQDTGECALTAQCTCSDPARAKGAQWTCVR
jgi:hypothetical protein